MIAACLIAVAVLSGTGALAPVGLAKHYEQPGALARVAAVRGMSIAWGHIDGLAAGASCAWVDARRPYYARARFRRGPGWGPWEVYQLVDCPQTRHLAAHRRSGLVLEVDYQSAVRNGFAWDGQTGRGRTQVQINAIFRRPAWSTPEKALTIPLSAYFLMGGMRDE